MSKSALERIQELEQKHQAEVGSLRREAISELVARIADAKRVLADLAEQYALITGKTLTGETAASAPKSSGRIRLKPEQKAALAGQIAAILGKGSMALGEVVGRLPGFSTNSVRLALKDRKQFKMEGSRGNARYSVK